MLRSETSSYMQRIFMLPYCMKVIVVAVYRGTWLQAHRVRAMPCWRMCSREVFYVLSFIEELEVGQRKLVCQDKTILKGGSDRANRLELYYLNEKLAKSLSLVLVILFFFKLSLMLFFVIGF